MNHGFMVDLNNIRARTMTVKEYIDSADEKNRELLIEMYNSYNLKLDVLDELRPIIKDVTVVVLSALWCKDCKNAMPVLLHLEEKIGMDIRMFGGIKTAPLDPDRQWAVPPSPPEIDDWKVKAIPWFEFFDKKGNRVATLIEKPTVKETLEEEILYVLKNK